MSSYDDLKLYLEAAQLELQCASAVLIETSAAEACAALHLARGWHGIACFVAVKAGRDLPSFESFIGALDLDNERFPKELPRQDWMKDMESFLQAGVEFPWKWRSARKMTGSLWWAHCNFLERVLEAHVARLRREYGITFWSSKRVRWICYVLTALLMISLLGWGIHRLIQGPPAWYGVYFDNPDLGGSPKAAMHYRSLNLDWGLSAPVSIFASDLFSALFTACLKVEQPRKVVFTLGSDDGARLKLDGKTIIDRWGPNAFSTDRAEIEISAGVHLLQVEYNELKGFAKLLLMSEPPEMLTGKHLFPPQFDAAGHLFCAKNRNNG